MLAEYKATFRRQKKCRKGEAENVNNFKENLDIDYFQVTNEIIINPKNIIADIVKKYESHPSSDASV